MGIPCHKNVSTSSFHEGLGGIVIEKRQHHREESSHQVPGKSFREYSSLNILVLFHLGKEKIYLNISKYFLVLRCLYQKHLFD